jgi:hypothetical protein
MKIRPSLEVGVIASACRVRGHAWVLVCLGCRTSFRASISNIAADRKDGVHPALSGIVRVFFPGLGLKIRLDGGVNNDGADPTTAAGLLRFFGDLAR